MPKQISVTTPAPLGSITVPVDGDPMEAIDVERIAQAVLNIVAGGLQVASPTGSIGAFAGPSIPPGWLLANGQAISRTTYAALFAVIGTDFGAGNGTTTFNVPDLRGRVIVGAGFGPGLTNRVRGATGGEETHTLTVQEMPAHRHDAPTPKSTGSSGGVNGYELGQPVGERSYPDYDYAGSAPTNITGGDGAHNVMQPWLALNPVIRS